MPLRKNGRWGELRVTRSLLNDTNMIGMGLLKCFNIPWCSVVQAYRFGRPVVIDQRLKTRIRRAEGMDCRPRWPSIPICLIDYVQCPEPSFAVKRVVHDVQRPTAIELRGQIQRLSRPLW